MLFKVWTYGSGQLLKDTQCLLNLSEKDKKKIKNLAYQEILPDLQQQMLLFKLKPMQMLHKTLTRILFESLRRPFSATGSSPIFGRINLASFTMAAVSSSPSLRIFQFLSPIFDTRSIVILSLKKNKKRGI